MFRNRKIIIAAVLLGACLFFSQSIFSQENGDSTAAEKEKTVETEKKTDTGGLAEKIQQDKTLKLTVDRVIEYLLRNNLDVKQALLEYKRRRLPGFGIVVMDDCALFGCAAMARKQLEG